MKKGIFVFVMGTVLGLASAAQALSSRSSFSSGGMDGWMVGLGVFRNTHTTAYYNQSTTEYTITHLDAKVGFIFPSGLYLGGAYTSMNLNNATGTTTNTESRTGTGASLGFYFGNFYLMGTYLISIADAFSSGTNFSGGSGNMAEVGYNSSVASNLFLGVGLVSKNFTWNQQSPGLPAAASNSQSDLHPSLNIGLTF